MTNTGKSIDLIATEEIAASLATEFLLARLHRRIFTEERVPVRGLVVTEGEHLNLWDAS